MQRLRKSFGPADAKRPCTSDSTATAATLHLRASEITQRLRSSTTDLSSPTSLWLITAGFTRDAITLHIAGSEPAVDHWLRNGRLVTASQQAFDQATA